MFGKIGKDLLKLAASVDILANKISELEAIECSPEQAKELDRLNILHSQILDLTGYGGLGDIYIGFCSELIDVCNKITNVAKLLNDGEE